MIHIALLYVLPYLAGWYLTSVLVARKDTRRTVLCSTGCQYRPCGDYLASDTHSPHCEQVFRPFSLPSALASGFIWPATLFYLGVKWGASVSTASTAKNHYDHELVARLEQECEMPPLDLELESTAAQQVTVISATHVSIDGASRTEKMRVYAEAAHGRVKLACACPFCGEQFEGGSVDALAGAYTGHACPPCR